MSTDCLRTPQHSSASDAITDASPIYVEESLLGEPVRKALDLVSWEAASDLVAKWNASGQVGVVRIEVPAIAETVVKHIADAEARNLQPVPIDKRPKRLTRRSPSMVRR